MGEHTRTGGGPPDGRTSALGELIHAAVRRAIEVAVDEELTAALGVRVYQRGDGRCGYRNGTKPRTLTGPTGPLALAIPRARLFTGTGEREWTSALLPRYQRRLREVNEAVIATYLAGGNSRRLRGALAPLLKAAPLSKSAVSRIVGTLKTELEAWRTRSLAGLDVLGLYLDALALRVRSAGKVVSVPVLGVIAVLTDGQKQLLALELCPGGETFEAWKGCLDDLVTRGLAAPLWCVIDGHPGLRKSVGLVWPPTLVQRCCVHKLRNLERKAPKHALAEIRTDFHRIVYARERGRRARRLHRVRAEVEAPLPRRGPQSPGGRGRAAHLLPVPQAPVEDAQDHERHRAPQRGVPPAREDAGQPAHRGRRAGPALRPRGQRAVRLHRLDGWRQIPAMLRARREAAA
jgi:putative transposase